ncbi:hypothetical protein D1614_18490 [Maribellus luteus]|uniref:Uncharacterized protein n=1 Tax=Maribellus luteus TaxID=2305463 RepID=A0A399SQR5_9BACT|nr:hypothetical protein D1614_18490 [Maribellus luteus]
MRNFLTVVIKQNHASVFLFYAPAILYIFRLKGVLNVTRFKFPSTVIHGFVPTIGEKTKAAA